MRDHFHSVSAEFETDGYRIRYHLFENPYETSGRRLLLMHGAGVAGLDTWGHLIPFLSGWSWVLVPDLRGMGESRPLAGPEQRFSVEEVAEDMAELIDHLGWAGMDLGGYSFGGLVAMLLKAAQPHRFEKQFLLEPALLDRASRAEVIRLRERYSEAAELMRTPGEEERGARLFLDAVAPNRIPSPRAEAITLARLVARPVGFSYALDAVTDAARRIDREALLDLQGSVSAFVGGRSVEAMHRFHQQLEQSLPDWRYHNVPGCDHSLPFQKPRQIARLMSADLADFLA